MEIFSSEFLNDSNLTTDKLPAIVMLVSFVITFILARAYTRIARKTGWGSASFGGIHAHHMVFGIVMSFIAGASSFALNLPPNSVAYLLLAALFGSGVALVLDEFALLFHLKDVYWSKEGRSSIDAVIIALILGVMLMIGVSPIGTEKNTTGYYLLITILLNLPLIIITGLKGKIIMAIFGVFVPFVALVGALRLAKPNSPWSRYIYKKDSKKFKRSTKRHSKYDTTWLNYKNKMWDFIGGKPY